MKRLEERRVLNADAAPIQQLVVDAGSAAGDGQADTYVVEQHDDHVRITVNGQEISSSPIADLNAIHIRGSLDDDILIAEFKSGEPLAGLDLLFDGGGGNDTVTLDGDISADQVTHELGTGENRIGIDSAGGHSTITYQGVETVNDRLASANRTFRSEGGGQEITLGDDGTSGNNISQIVSNDAGDDSELIILFENPTDSLRIETTATTESPDSIEVTGLDQSFSGDLDVHGSVDDLLTVRGPTDLGGGNLELIVGTIRIEDSLTTSHATVTLHAEHEIFVGENGIIANDAGSISLEAPSIVHDGLIAAAGSQVQLDGGDQGTTLVHGIIDVSTTDASQSPGNVQILGSYVGLFDAAQINASGAVAAGTVLIGGDYQGSNPAIRNAVRTYVAPNVVIRADALTAGNGGKVIVWADEITRFYGTITARGGAQGGNGGLAEVSGKLHLDYQGIVDLTATMGEAGELLLDPAIMNIQLAVGASDALLPLLPGDVLIDDAAPSPMFLSAARIVAQLALSNVTLEATSVINILTPIVAGAASIFRLTLDAPTINFSPGASITLLGADLTLQNGAATVPVADVVLNGSVTITSTGGDVNLRDTSVSAAVAGSDLIINSTPALAGIDGGAVVLGTFAAASSVNDLTVITTPGAGATAGTLTLTGNISLDHGLAADTAVLTFLSGGDIIVEGDVEIDTEQGDTDAGGAVNLGTSNIYASGAGRDLAIDTRGAGAGGAISFGRIDDNAGTNDFLNSLVADARSTVAGILELVDDILTDGLDVTLAGNVQLQASVVIDTEQGDDGPAGNVFLDEAVVSAAIANADLTLRTSTASIGENGGDVALGIIADLGGFFVRDLTVVAAGDVDPGSVTIGNNITTDGAQSYDGFVSLIAANTTLEGSTITFQNTVNGTAGGADESLAITGNAVFGNSAGDFVGNSVALASLTVSGTTAFNAGNVVDSTVRTVGVQTYTGTATLGANTTLEGSTITFQNTVNGTAGGADESLAITGNAVFGNSAGDFVGNSVALASLTVSGTTAFNAGNVVDSTVRTVGVQTYTGTATLGANTTLEGSTITFQNTVNGTAGGADESLAITGNAVFGNSAGDFVGNSVALASLTVSGTTAFNAGNVVDSTVRTVGVQTYTGTATLGANTTLEGSTITFQNTVNGTAGGADESLAITGNAVFGNSAGDFVGNSVALASLTVSGTTAFNAGNVVDSTVRTVGVQTYTGTATLGANTTLEGSTITFQNTVNGTAGGADESLAITGNAVFGNSAGDFVGNSVALASLTVSGTTAFNAGNVVDSTVRTVGVQTYTGTATLGANTTLEGSTITFQNTVNGTAGGADESLAITGNAVFGNSAGDFVGNSVALASLTVSGTTAFNAGNVVDSTVRTVGVQTYTGTATLGANTTLEGSTITFQNTVNGTAGGADESLAITGNAVFGNSAGDFVGNSVALASLTVSGTTAFNAGNVVDSTVRTVGVQTYTGTATLGANTTLEGSTITFQNTVNGTAGGADESLAITGNAVFGNSAGDFVGNSVALASLTVSGTTAFNAGNVVDSTVRTVGVQTYTGTATLGANTTLEGSTITFQNTVNGTAGGADESLAITGNAVFGNSAGDFVGNSVALASLTVSGTTAFNAGNVVDSTVRTVGVQTYTGTATLGANTTLEGSTITFQNTVNGTAGGADESLAITGNAVFGNSAGDFVGNSVALASLTVSGTTAFNAGNVVDSTVRTVGVQTYTGTATLGANTTLTSTASGIEFISTVNSETGESNGLTVSAGTGDVTLGGTIGGVTALSSLEVDGQNVSIANIGGAAAGVTGTTDIDAAAQLTFTGTNYRTAGTQTYEAAAGNNFLVNGGAVTSFLSSDDAISFNTANLLLANGSHLVVNTAGGAISILAIRGTSSEDVTLTSTGGTANTISVGAIGSANEINTVAITATTSITLNGNITTSDAAGNTVTLEAATLNMGSVTIDTDNAGTDGNVTFVTNLLQNPGIVNAGGATFQIRPTVASHVIEFADDDSAGIVHNAFYDADFTNITAGLFLIGGLAQAGAIHIGNALAALVFNHSLEARTTGQIILESDYDSSAAAQPGHLRLFSGTGINGGVTLRDIAVDGVVTLNLGLGALEVEGKTTLADNAVINAGGGITFHHDIDADDALPNDRTLTLNATTAGIIRVEGHVGANESLAGLTIVQSNGATFLGSVDVTDGATGTIAITDTEDGDDVKFEGDIKADAFTTGAANYNVVLFGSENEVRDDTTFNNTGVVTLGNNASDMTQFTGGLDTTAALAGTNVAGTVATVNNQMDLGVTTMLDNATLKSGNQAINVASITDGALSLSLDLQDAAATGAVTFLGNLTVNDLDTFAGAYSVALQGTTNLVDTDTNFLNTGTVTLGNQAGDSTTFTGGLATTGNATNPGLTNVAGTVATVNNQMDLGGTTMLDNATLKSGSAAINVASITDGALNFSLDLQDAAATGAVTFLGNLTVNDLDTFAGAYSVALQGTTNLVDTDTNFLNTGTVTLGNQAGDSTTFTGGLATTGNATNPGLTNVAGTVATVNNQMDLGGTTMLDNATLKSGSAAINVASITDGALSFSLDLQDAAATGAVTFLGNLTVNDLDTFAGAYSVALQGTTNLVDTDTNFLNTGTVTLGNQAGDSTTFTGGLATTGNATNPGLTNVAGTVATVNNQMDLGGTTMLDNATLKSGSAAINVASITDGALNFSLDLQDAAATGAVTFLGNLTVNDLDTFAGAYSVALQGTTNLVDTDTNFLNTGTVTLGNEAADNSTFTGGLDTTAALGGTNVAGTVATVNNQMDLGGTTMLDNATLKSGSAAINVASITDGALNLSLDLQDNTAASTGTVTFSGDITVNDLNTFARPYSVALHGATNEIVTDTTFLNTGAGTFVTLGNNGGDVTTFVNGVTATAPGAVTIAGTIAANVLASAIILGDGDTPVTVTDNANLGGTATGAIDLGDATINSGFTLQIGTGIGNHVELDAVTGVNGGAKSHLKINTTTDVNVAEAIGTDIGAITIDSANNFTAFDTITSDTLKQVTGTGVTEFKGDVTTSTLVDLKTNKIRIQGTAADKLTVKATAANGVIKLDVAAIPTSNSPANFEFMHVVLSTGDGGVTSGGQITEETFAFDNAENRYTALDSSEVLFPPPAGGLTNSQRTAQIRVRVDDFDATNPGRDFVITLDWLERPAILDLDTIDGTASGVYLWEPTHTYLEHPLSSPSADIPMRVHITSLAGGSIQPSIGGQALVGAVDNLTGNFVNGAIGITRILVINVLALPSVSPLTPPPETLPANPIVPSMMEGNLQVVDWQPQRATLPFDAAAAGVTSEGEQRFYELRIVVFDEDGNLIELKDPKDKIPLDDEKLKAIHPFNPSKLPALFGRLPADRYRIYLIEDGSERLVIEFIIQQGQPIETPEIEEIDADAADGAANPFGDDPAGQPNVDDGAAESIMDQWLPAVPVAPADAAAHSDRASFAERLGNASFVSHGGVVLGAAALSYAASDRWEKSIERVMERFDRRRRLPGRSRREKSEPRTRNTSQREPAQLPL